MLLQDSKAKKKHTDNNIMNKRRVYIAYNQIVTFLLEVRNSDLKSNYFIKKTFYNILKYHFYYFNIIFK